MQWLRRNLVALLACGTASLAHAADPARITPTGITSDANVALQNMAKTLAAENMSFKARTLRVYQDASGDFLHIGHVITIAVRRPDHLGVIATGDDGVTKLIYDGKQISAFDANSNKHTQIVQTGDLDKMVEDLSDKIGIDFPLGDFLRKDPAKSFLTGVTSGREIGTTNVDGTPCRHLFFTQTGSIELQLWLEKTERSLPRRFVITYRSMPGQPNFIAEFSDWDLQTRVPDAEFAFQPPAGSTKVDLADIKDRGAPPANAGSKQ